jgi:hypothetical protein
MSGPYQHAPGDQPLPDPVTLAQTAEQDAAQLLAAGSKEEVLELVGQAHANAHTRIQESTQRIASQAQQYVTQREQMLQQQLANQEAAHQTRYNELLSAYQAQTNLMAMLRDQLNQSTAAKAAVSTSTETPRAESAGAPPAIPVLPNVSTPMAAYPIHDPHTRPVELRGQLMKYRGGDDDLERWLTYMEFRFSRVINFSEHAKFTLACEQLEDAAADWFLSTLRTNDPTQQVNSWEELKASLREHFQQTHRMWELRVQLSNCAQGNRTLSAYVAEFQRLVNQFTNISESEKVFLFCNSLRDPQLKAVIKRDMPSTLREAIRLAHASDVQSGIAGPLGGPAHPPTHRNDAMDLDNLQLENVVCYGCQQRGHLVRNCPRRRKQSRTLAWQGQRRSNRRIDGKHGYTPHVNNLETETPGRNQASYYPYLPPNYYAPPLPPTHLPYAPPMYPPYPPQSPHLPQPQQGNGGDQ